MDLQNERIVRIKVDGYIIQLGFVSPHSFLIILLFFFLDNPIMNPAEVTK